MTWYWSDFLKHQQYQWRLWAVNTHSKSAIYRFMELVSIRGILYIAVVVGFYMLPPLPRSTKPQFHMNTAHSETGGTKYLSGTSSLYMRFFISHSWKKQHRICQKTENRFSTSKLPDSVRSPWRLLNEQKNTQWRQCPSRRAVHQAIPRKSGASQKNQVPGLQVLASLVERGEPREFKWVRKTGRKLHGFWDWGPYPYTIHVWYIYLPLVDFYGKCIHVSKYSIHGSYGLHRLHPTWIIYLADSGALSSPILLENDTSALFAGCFSCRLYGHPCWWTLFQAPIS